MMFSHNHPMARDPASQYGAAHDEAHLAYDKKNLNKNRSAAPIKNQAILRGVTAHLVLCCPVCPEEHLTERPPCAEVSAGKIRGVPVQGTGHTFARPLHENPGHSWVHRPFPPDGQPDIAGLSASSRRWMRRFPGVAPPYDSCCSSIHWLSRLRSDRKRAFLPASIVPN